MTISALEHCQLCPHGCGANRHQRLGLCRSPHTPVVASVCRHTGEEPPVSGVGGICNVFFAGCNMRCTYCQNHQISRSALPPQPHWLTSVGTIADSIEALLQQGCTAVGFVSPTHQVPQMLIIIEELHQRGLHPRVVYNSNGYDSLQILRLLEGVVDVYLPDFKYSDNRLARRCSGVLRYAQTATEAIAEMYRQKGASLVLNEQGEAEFGLIVRHLVLPGHVANSIGVLRRIAGRISPRVHVSLMAQYYPPSGLVLRGGLSRQLNEQEYAAVVAEYNALQLRGWMQDLSSAQHYRPDFESTVPFDGCC
ncbi:MAG: radical SAM protein [Bacteroidales bacterium]|nr:radical SAM protein [Bacteroidales bacterium]